MAESPTPSEEGMGDSILRYSGNHFQIQEPADNPHKHLYTERQYVLIHIEQTTVVRVNNPFTFIPTS